MDTAACHGLQLPKVPACQSLPTSTLRSRHAFGRKRAVPPRRRVNWHVRISSQAGFRLRPAKTKEEVGEKVTDSEPPSERKQIINLPAEMKSPGTLKVQNQSRSQATSNKVVFAAGATGKVGSRTVRELLKLGFSIRASTRNVEKAQALFQDVGSSTAGAKGSDDGSPRGIFSPANFFGFLKPKAAKKLEIVECNLEDSESIESALGNAGVVVCCIGASEKEVLDVSGPYRIDFKATANLINAASAAGVSHFVLLTSLGTQKFGFPAAILNLFWGVLLWKAKAEKTLLQSGIPYTIVRPGGMERPTDTYKETHNLVLAEADKWFGGQVSNLQIAELMATIVENPDVSVNKIVEAVAETTAPLRPIRELLGEIPVRGVAGPEPPSVKKAKPAKTDVDEEEAKNLKESRGLAFKEREEKRIQAEKLAEEKRAQAQKEKEAKRIQAERDEKEKQRLQELRKKYEEEIEAAREKAEAAKSAAAAALAEKDELEKKAAETRAKAEAAALAARQAKAVEAAVLAEAQKGNVLSDEEKQKILDSVKLATLPKEAAAPSKQTKDIGKKKTGFSFLGRGAPSSTTTGSTIETDTEKSIIEDTESKVKSKADEKKLTRKQEEAKRKEEQERLDKNAKERAEKEAVQSKQKEKAEAERKEKEQAEAKEKAEEQERLEAEAKSKKEEAAEALKKKDEEKAKAEAEAKRKKEEERVKMEAEVKREQELAEAKQKEEEEKAKAEAEAKRSEEEDTAKIEAEAKRIQEGQAEAKKVEPKEKAQAEADAQRQEDEVAKAKTKEEDVAEKLETEAEKGKEEIETTKKKAEQDKAKTLVEEKKEETISVAAEEEPRKTESPPPRWGGFRWFWQSAEPGTPEIVESVKREVTDGPVKAKLADQLPPCPTPLSPYTQYPGLKPPVPPIASPPAVNDEKAAPADAAPRSFEDKVIDQTKVELETTPAEKTTVLSEAPRDELQDDVEARTRKIQDIAEREKEALEKAEASALSFDWPQQKPEVTLDEPAISKEEEPASSLENQGTASSAANTLPPSSRPLSPYAQYPNLKPPILPKPSSAPQNESAVDSKPAETLPVSSNTSSPYPGVPDLKPPTSPAPERNGAPAAEAKEEEAPEPSVSVGFKWPWQQ